MLKEYDQLTNDHSDHGGDEEDQKVNYEVSPNGDNNIMAALETTNPSPHFGSNFIFGMKSNGQPRFTLGPHYPLFLCTWISFLTADILLTQLVWSNADSWVWTSLTALVCLVHLGSYLGTAITNPGIAHAEDSESLELKRIDSPSRKQKDKIICKVCKVLKDSRTMHCDSCKVCVRGYDHHCPWTGKCIAKGNMTWFNIFLSMTFFYMAFAVIVTVVTLMPTPRYRVPPASNSSK